MARPKGPATFYDLAAITKRSPETLLLDTCIFCWNLQDEGSTRRGAQSTRDRIVEFLKEYDQKQPQPSWAVQWISVVYDPTLGPWATSQSKPCPSDDTSQEPYVPTFGQYKVLLEYFSHLALDERDLDQSALRILNTARRKERMGSVLEYWPNRILSTEIDESGIEPVQTDNTNTEKVVPMETDKTVRFLSEDGSSTSYSEGEVYVLLQTYISRPKSSSTVPVADESTGALKRKREPDEDDYGGKKKKGLKSRKDEAEWVITQGDIPGEGLEEIPKKSQKKLSKETSKKKMRKSFSLQNVAVPFVLPGPPESNWIRPVLPMQTGEDISSAWRDDTFSSGPADIIAPTIGKAERPEARSFHLWARFRPELCETTPYFRSFQGGVHRDSKSGLMGYLLDGHPSPGDIWARDGRLIISHGGGGSAPDLNPQPTENQADSHQDVREQKRTKRCPERHVPASEVVHPRNTADIAPVIKPGTPSQAPGPKPSLKRDQFRSDTSIQKLLLAKEQGVPIALIVGKDYRWWPLQMRRMGENEELSTSKADDGRARYAVLGWYMIRDAWEELEPEVSEIVSMEQGRETEGSGESGSWTRLYVRWKFAFEWVEAQGDPWWVNDLDAKQGKGSREPSQSAADLPPIQTSLDSEVVSPVPEEAIQITETPANPVLDSPVTVKVTEEPVEQVIFDSDLPSPITSKSSQRTESPLVNKLERSCDSCGVLSPRIYHEGWFCTNSQCHYHSMLLDGRLSTQMILSYSKDFLSRPSLPEPSRRSMKEGDVEFLDTSEGTWSVVPLYRPGSKSFEREHWQGLSCYDCGRLNSRIEWSSWSCAACGQIIQSVPRIVYPADLFNKPEFRSRNDFASDIFSIQTPVLPVSEWADCFSCHLPDGGDVIVLRPHRLDEFDELFQDYQKDATMKPMFTRVPLKYSYVPGQHTSHFIHNAGAHYSYICRVRTDPFTDCPQSVLKARELLEESVSTALDRSVTFNEVLTCAYKNEQSMNFHSDDEPGVQSVIASISLGSSASMSFRKKAKRKEKGKPVCFEITLRHGDILIMDGANIQKNYEHRVVPSGLRFAATARLILSPSSLESKAIILQQPSAPLQVQSAPDP